MAGERLGNAQPTSLPRLYELVRAAAARLESIETHEFDVSPSAELRAANALAAQGALLTAIAKELEARVYDDLGRYAAEVVEQGAEAGGARAAAELVAGAFLALHQAK